MDPETLLDNAWELVGKIGRAPMANLFEWLQEHEPELLEREKEHLDELERVWQAAKAKGRREAFLEAAADVVALTCGDTKRELRQLFLDKAESGGDGKWASS